MTAQIMQGQDMLALLGPDAEIPGATSAPEIDISRVGATLSIKDGQSCMRFIAEAGKWGYMKWGVFATGHFTHADGDECDMLFPYLSVTAIRYDSDELNEMVKEVMGDGSDAS